MQRPWSQPLSRPQSPYLKPGAWTQAPWEAGCRPPPTPAQAEQLLSSLGSWALYTPLWLPWCPASEPSLATSMSPKSPGHAASGSTGQTTVSIGQLCVAWICQAASRQSDLGHVLPRGWGRPCPAPIPHPGLPATPGENGSVVRRQNREGQGPGLQRGCQPPAGVPPCPVLQAWEL